MSIVLAIKKTELEVGKHGYYRQGGTRSIKKGAHLFWRKELKYSMT